MEVISTDATADGVRWSIPCDTIMRDTFQSVGLMSKKELLAETLFRSRLLRPITGLLPKGLTILCYHRIRPDVESAEYLFDEGVLGPFQSEFERQVKWLKSNFDILSESELLGLISKPLLSKRGVAITFDDGYRDNYELAYPVLRAYGAPAIFFLCPGLIDGRCLGLSVAPSDGATARTFRQYSA